jgi:peptidoglycan/LPS O-acetylase OafA/YrhL
LKRRGATDAGYAWRWFYFGSPYCRFAQFILGGAAAAAIMHDLDLRFRRTLQLLSALALVGLVWLYWRWTMFGNSPTLERADLMQAVCFAILMANARAPTTVNHVLSSRVLLLFGTISYSLYLFQGFGARIVSGQNNLSFTPELLPRFAFSFTLSLVFASLLARGPYHSIEMPAQRWLRQFLPRVRGSTISAEAALATPAE